MPHTGGRPKNQLVDRNFKEIIDLINITNYDGNESTRMLGTIGKYMGLHENR